MVDVAKKDKLLDTIASHTIDVDEIVDERREQFTKRSKELVQKPSERTPELWSMLMIKSDLDPKKWANLTSKDLNSVLVSKRGFRWRRALKTIYAIAVWQAYMEVMLVDMVKLSDDNAKEVHTISRKLDSSTSRTAAKEGIKRKRAEQKEVRKIQKGLESGQSTQTKTSGTDAARKGTGSS